MSFNKNSCFFLHRVLVSINGFFDSPHRSQWTISIVAPALHKVQTLDEWPARWQLPTICGELQCQICCARPGRVVKKSHRLASMTFWWFEQKVESTRLNINPPKYTCNNLSIFNLWLFASLLKWREKHLWKCIIISRGNLNNLWCFLSPGKKGSTWNRVYWGPEQCGLV